METLVCKDPLVRYDSLMFWILIGVWIWIPIFSLIFLRPLQKSVLEREYHWITDGKGEYHLKTPDTTKSNESNEKEKKQ